MRVREAIDELAGQLSEENNEQLAIQLCTALGRIGPPPRRATLAALMDRLTDGGSAVRAACIRALTALSGQKIGDDIEGWRTWFDRVSGRE